jgi:hypothetical protein
VAFSLLFAVQAIHLEKEGNTVCDTSGETSTDGKIDDDTADDEDVDDGSLEPQTGLSKKQWLTCLRIRKSFTYEFNTCILTRA